MIKKTFLIFISTIVLCSYGIPVLAATTDPEKPKTPLELVYPVIPGEINREVMNQGLPEYIGYILNLAMMLIGIVIFGVLILNGVKWMTSAGNASKLKDAKDGITAAFLGAIILFSAFIVFKTINPQLVILKLGDPEAVEPVVFAGIYICNYDIESGYLQGLIDGYISENKDTRLESTKKLKEVMDNQKGRCYRMNSSANTLYFAFAPLGISKQNVARKTLFQIPEKNYSADEDGKTIINWTYDYGVIFHQKDYMRGKCSAYIYTTPFHPDLGFDAAFSATVFRKPFTEPDSESKGAIIYECIDYNNISFCPHDLQSAAVGYFYPKGEDFAWIDSSNLLNSGLAIEEKGVFHSNVRSIKIDPEGYYFAVLFDSDVDTGDKVCQVISQSDNNLLNDPIGQCGTDCKAVINDKNISAEELNAKCYPCTKSMFVVKGMIL